MNNRTTWIDISKGIGIILVIIGHTSIPNFLTILIFSFHMPLFFVISGFLFNKKKYLDNFSNFIYKKSSTLLWPFYTFSLLTILINYTNSSLIINNENLTNLILGNDSLNTPLWFLTALFSVELLFFIALKYFKNSNYLLVIGLIITIGFINSIFFKLSFFFNLHIAFIALLFFTIGWLLKKYDYIRFINEISIKYILFISLLMIFIVFSNERIDMYSMTFGNIIYFIIGSILGSILIIFISLKVSNKHFISQFLSFFGKHSLPLLAIHTIIPKLTKNIFLNLPLGLDKILNLLILIFIVYLINRYFSSLLIFKGNKKNG